MPERPVAVAGVGLLCPAGIGVEGAVGGRPGEVPGFRPHAYIEDRKKLKLMTRAVRLGVSGVRLALAAAPGWDAVPAERRGLYVGSSPQQGEVDDLRPALERSTVDDGFDIGLFGKDGFNLIHPLWLVRGLSNNVLGFASAIHDMQGTNMSYCDGEEGGWTALVEGFRAVAEGRADLVVAGGSDSLIGAEVALGGRRCGEGAGFVVFRPAVESASAIHLNRKELWAEEHALGFLGAATWPVALARKLLS